MQDGTSPYFGAVVGRVANRIANATFSLGNKHYKLTANDPPNSLHGGVWGFSRKSWDILRSEVNDNGYQAVKLGVISNSGDEARHRDTAQNLQISFLNSLDATCSFP